MRTHSSSTIISFECRSQHCPSGRPGNVRVVGVEAPVLVGVAQLLQQHGAQRAHRGRFEPALRRQPQHRDDFGSVRLREPLGSASPSEFEVKYWFSM